MKVNTRVKGVGSTGSSCIVEVADHEDVAPVAVTALLNDVIFYERYEWAVSDQRPQQVQTHQENDGQDKFIILDQDGSSDPEDVAIDHGKDGHAGQDAAKERHAAQSLLVRERLLPQG